MIAGRNVASRSLRQKLSTALETGRRPHILLTFHPHLSFQEIKLSATWVVLEAQGHRCTPTQKRKQVMCPQNSLLCQYGLHQRGAIWGHCETHVSPGPVSGKGRRPTKNIGWGSPVSFSESSPLQEPCTHPFLQNEEHIEILEEHVPGNSSYFLGRGFRIERPQCSEDLKGTFMLLFYICRLSELLS